MNNWFTVKVKYTKQLEDGRLKRVTEPYLIDAVSFMEAETRMMQVIEQTVQGDVSITGISKTEFADIFYYEDSETWYKCKLTYVSIDGDEGKEKKVANNFLVTASNVKEAYDRIHESMSDMLVSFEIPSIMISPIVEVIPYEPNLDVEIGRRPLQEGDVLVDTSAKKEYKEEAYEEEEETEELENFDDEEDFDEDEDNVSFEDETN